MAEKLTTFDPAEGLTSDNAIAAFMEEAFKTEDVGYIAHALGVVARAKGMTQIANETGLSREQLYRSFSETGNPTLKTTIAVMKALGIALTATPASDPTVSSAAQPLGRLGAPASRRSVDVAGCSAPRSARSRPSACSVARRLSAATLLLIALTACQRGGGERQSKVIDGIRFDLTVTPPVSQGASRVTGPGPNPQPGGRYRLLLALSDAQKGERVNDATATVQLDRRTVGPMAPVNENGSVSYVRVLNLTDGDHQLAFSVSTPVHRVPAVAGFAYRAAAK